MIHTDQDNLLESHMERNLQRHIGYRRPFPDAAPYIRRETRACVGGVEECRQLGNWQIGREMTPRTPCQKLGHGQAKDFICELLDNQVIDRCKVSSAESQL